jgi:predicted ABC-type ATPase
LYFICTIDAAINIDRVKQRVILGGHDVPEEKILSRYGDSLEVLSFIIPEIDNKRKLIVKTKHLPWWIDEFVIQKIYM